MTLFQIIVGLLVVVLSFLLLVYFIYTIYAVFRGAVFIPTPRRAVRQMLELGQPAPTDTVMDLGSGDGRILRACAKSGARCLGIEINLLLVWFSRLRLWLAGCRNTQVVCQDFWHVSFAEVDLLVLFLVPIKMERLKNKIKKEMKPGSRVVSYRYVFPDWPYQEQRGKVYLYIV